MISSRVLHEDNHLIAVNKKSSEIVQGDRTGDTSMPDEIKAYLKKKIQQARKCFLWRNSPIGQANQWRNSLRKN